MTARQSSGPRSVTLPEAITVKGLSERLGISPIEAIKRLMTHGVMAAMNDTIDYETAAIVSSELGIAPSPEAAPGAVATAVRADEEEATEEAGAPRPPVVTILGHVDHGKTSLLDAIRETNVVAGEAGGITQHIGAYQIERGGSPITFIDTPGHAAFTAMRARGAQITDIAVIVVAADDGVMPQTIEAIDHVRAADVPMIIAINKTDLPAADADRVKQQLTEQSVVVEEYGGDVLAVPVSATTGTGLPELLEAIDLVSEIQELNANAERFATGTVIEAELDSRRGALATVLVRNGTLRQGDALVSGLISGKVKAMFDERGERLKEAGPARPVRIMGLEDVPAAGDAIEVVESERAARRIVEQARREEEGAAGARRGGITLDTLFNEVSAGNVKELLLILKTDVRGSAEAIRGSLQGLGTGEVKVKVIHSATGSVSESDVMLAGASGAIILAFNVRTETSAASQAEINGVEIRTLRGHLPAHRERRPGPRRSVRTRVRARCRRNRRGPPALPLQPCRPDRRLLRHRWHAPPRRSRPRPPQRRRGRRHELRRPAPLPGRRTRGAAGLRVRGRPRTLRCLRGGRPPGVLPPAARELARPRIGIAMSRRTSRVSELLREEISDLVQRDLKDPRLEGALLSVTEVEVSAGLRTATVFVSHLGAVEEREDALAGLQSASSWLERELRRRLRMRRTPSLTFQFDPSIERGARLASTIAELARDRDPGDES